ncbi:MAG: hypothetical protein KBT44_06250 [Bacteroidales bacterium]|nr:hypothetical protein [Candidatus Equibacterium intestinale]
MEVSVRDPHHASSLFKAGVTVCGNTRCLIPAPDGYTGTIADSYDASTWPEAQAAGLVCLVTVGCRVASPVRVDGSYSTYWSSTVIDGDQAYFTYIGGGGPGNIISPEFKAGKCTGFSVRLVTDVPASL